MTEYLKYPAENYSYIIKDSLSLDDLFIKILTLTKTIKLNYIMKATVHYSI